MRETYTQISTTHFINDVTGESFEVGQKICLTPNCGIGDCSERFFMITKFWVSEVGGIHEENNGKSFEFVYANFDDDPFGKSMHINNIMLMDEDPRFMVWPMDMTLRHNLIDEYSKARQEKYYDRRKYLILI